MDIHVDDQVVKIERKEANNINFIIFPHRRAVAQTRLATR